jgi:ABC-2 type transport system ATP-binding protein
MLEAVELSKRFGLDRLALDQLNIQVRPGELYCLLGAHGSGKTTAVNLFLDFYRPTSGRALVDGFEVARFPIDAKRRISFIGGASALYPGMTARQNIEFFTRVAGTRIESRARTYDVLRQFGVPERLFERKVADVPPEIRLLIWLSIASLRETPVLLLDEPTAGLDSRATADLQDHLLDFKRQQKAILLATSDVLLATQVSDRIGILKHGHMVVERTRSQMLGQSLTELYFDYVGRPPRNGAPAHGQAKHPS